jgi:hypothetical protein
VSASPAAACVKGAWQLTQYSWSGGFNVPQLPQRVGLRFSDIAGSFLSRPALLAGTRSIILPAQEPRRLLRMADYFLVSRCNVPVIGGTGGPSIAGAYEA